MQTKPMTRYSKDVHIGAPGHESVDQAINGERKWRTLARKAQDGTPRKYGRGGMSTDGKSSNIWALIVQNRIYPATNN